jgi:hypothetical protein
MPTEREATIDDLYHVPDHGKAEIVNGKLVLISPAGALPSLVRSAPAALCVFLAPLHALPLLAPPLFLARP